MKYLKKFENNTEIEIGDYVLCSYQTISSSPTIKNLSDFINNNIGVVTNSDEYYCIDIKYDNVPANIILFFNGDDLNIRSDINIQNVLFFGKTIEDIEIQISTNKYNI